MQPNLHYVEYPDIDIQVKYPNKMVNTDAPQEWNLLPSELKVVGSLSLFKHRLKRFLLSHWIAYHDSLSFSSLRNTTFFGIFLVYLR